MKRCLLLFLVLGLSGCNSFASEEQYEEEIDMSQCSVNKQLSIDETRTLYASDLWTHASVCENLVFENNGIKQIDNTLNGVLETDEIVINDFLELVPSWNVEIDEESSVTFLVSIGNENGMSHYYSMGYWRDEYKASFGRQEDEYGKVYIDTIVSKEKGIDRIKIKVIIGSSDTSDTIFRNVSITTKVSLDTFYDFSVLEEKVIDVPSRQQLSIPSIGNSICSPTSLSMVMTYYGYNDSQEDVAGSVFDKGANIYGNWSFNASYPGGFGLYSRVEYMDNLEELMEYIRQDIPVVLSIKTTTKEELEGTIMAYPSGHLIVLTGFKLVDNVWYAVVNDPAEYTDDSVSREYILSELLSAWRGYTYVVTDEELK